MNISLNNRKELSTKINNFIEEVILEPELIKDICNKEIDENYVELIKKLKSKLEYIK